VTILTLLMHHSLSIEPKRYWNGAVAYPICRSVSTWVCLSRKCIVAKWLIGSDVLSDREWVQSRDGCIRWGEGKGALLGVNLRCPTVSNGDFVA